MLCSASTVQEQDSTPGQQDTTTDQDSTPGQQDTVTDQDSTPGQQDTTTDQDSTPGQQDTVTDQDSTTTEQIIPTSGQRRQRRGVSQVRETHTHTHTHTLNVWLYILHMLYLCRLWGTWWMCLDREYSRSSILSTDD